MSNVDLVSFAAAQARVMQCFRPHTCYQSRLIQFAKVLFQSWIAWCKYILASSKLGSILMASLKSSTASLYLPADMLGNIFHLNTQQTVVKGTVSHYCTYTKLWFFDRMSLIIFKRCEKSKRTLKNPFASRLAEFDSTLKLLKNYRLMIYCYC